MSTRAPSRHLTIRFRGVDRFKRRLRELERRAAAFGDMDRVPVAELFPPEFMRRHTDFATFDELVAESGHDVDSLSDIDRIPEAHWDAVVRRNSGFGSWAEMRRLAEEGWVRRELGL